MGRLLMKSETIAVDERRGRVRYFERRTARGARRYCAEILLEPDVRIILDDDSVISLETRACRMMPASLTSRRLGGM
jgi:hypothetical protein